MRSPSLLVSVIATALVVACGGPSSSSDDVDESAGALSSSREKDIKTAAKAAIKKVMQLDEQKKYEEGKQKHLDDGGFCFELIAKLLPDHKSDGLSKVRIHAVGRNGRQVSKAADKMCDLVINKLDAACSMDTPDVEIHEFDKKECDGDKIYVGLVGDNKEGEDALKRHHRYDELKNGDLLIGWQDAAADDDEY